MFSEWVLVFFFSPPLGYLSSGLCFRLFVLRFSLWTFSVNMFVFYINSCLLHMSWYTLNILEGSVLRAVPSSPWFEFIYLADDGTFSLKSSYHHKYGVKIRSMILRWITLN